MENIRPKGEKLRQAVKWISEKLQDDEKRPVNEAIQQAALHFNLSPKDEEFLISFYKK